MIGTAGEEPWPTARGRGPGTAQGELVLDRAFRLLGSFGPDHRSLSLTSLSARSGLPKPTALRLARKLAEWGALERTADGRYVIGLRLLEVASLAPRGHGLRATALPYLEDLHQATGQHVLLAVRDGREAVLVERLSAHGAGTVRWRRCPWSPGPSGWSRPRSGPPSWRWRGRSHAPSPPPRGPASAMTTLLATYRGTGARVRTAAAPSPSTTPRTGGAPRIRCCWRPGSPWSST